MTIDIIGDLYKPINYPEGWTIEDPHPELIQYPGYHVNITKDLLEEYPDLEAYRVYPEVLNRVWAGDCPIEQNFTIPLRFDTESHFLEIFPSEMQSIEQSTD